MLAWKCFSTKEYSWEPTGNCRWKSVRPLAPSGVAGKLRGSRLHSTLYLKSCSSHGTILCVLRVNPRVSQSSGMCVRRWYFIEYRSRSCDDTHDAHNCISLLRMKKLAYSFINSEPPTSDPSDATRKLRSISRSSQMKLNYPVLFWNSYKLKLE